MSGSCSRQELLGYSAARDILDRLHCLEGVHARLAEMPDTQTRVELRELIYRERETLKWRLQELQAMIEELKEVEAEEAQEMEVGVC